MAYTQLADIYNPLVFQAAIAEKAIEKNVLIQSGAVVQNPVLNDMASTGGNIGELPFTKKLGTSSEPDYTDDNASNVSTPAKIEQGKMIYRLASMHGSWSTMDLARELALIDPVEGITDKIGGWWSTQIQKRVVQTGMGVLADNDANDSDDMLNDVSLDTADAVTDAERITATNVLDTKQTMGDHAGDLKIIAMHSVLYTRLQKQNLIDYVQLSDSKVLIPTYLGYMVLVDDGMPAVAGSNRITYTVMLLGEGAIEMGAGTPMMPSELERDASAGYGGGQDILHSRRSDIIHPYGMQFTSSSVGGQSATLAELATAANWDRVVTRKNIPMAFLKVND